MVKCNNTNNPLPSNSMKDLKDDALAYDDFINSDADEVVDRFSNPFPTVRKQVAVRIVELVGASRSALAVAAKTSENNTASTQTKSVKKGEFGIAGAAPAMPLVDTLKAIQSQQSGKYVTWAGSVGCSGTLNWAT